VALCALESLALGYRWVLGRLEELTGRRLEVIHVVGGGSQNVLLNQLTADPCDRPVLAGPAEATATGNVLVQAIGLGMLGSLADAREVVRRSFEVRTYEPQTPEQWQEPYTRFRGLLERVGGPDGSGLADKTHTSRSPFSGGSQNRAGSHVAPGRHARAVLRTAAKQAVGRPGAHRDVERRFAEPHGPRQPTPLVDGSPYNPPVEVRRP
jgi:hypothetical protein